MKLNQLMSELQNNKYLSRSFLANKLNISESTVRKWISDTNDIGIKNGFVIEYERGKGYFLEILNKEKYHDFLSKKSVYIVDGYSNKQREKVILFILFQSNDYITYDWLAEQLSVSKATVIRDMTSIENKLKDNGLFLEKRSHYGIKVTGPEKEYRTAFVHFVTHNNMFVKPVEKIKSFSNNLDINNIRFILNKLLNANNLSISNVAFENIAEHIAILIYRGKSKNYVEEKYDYIVDDLFIKISNEIIEWVNNRYGIQLPKQEIKLLAAQISGKTKTDLSESNEKRILEGDILDILKEIDTEFLTSVANDEKLKNALVIHVFPLLNRMYNNIQLENPLIDEVYREYANIFLLAIRFSEMIEQKYNFKLSKDETGYIALHFAAHFERIKNKKKEFYKNIIVVSMSVGGNTQLLITKLERVFPKAIIKIASLNELQRIKEDKPDLILSTIPIDYDFGDIPILTIKEWLDESEIFRIEDIIIQMSSNEKVKGEVNNILSLLNKDLFYTNIDENDYFEILKFMADDATRKGYAQKGYSDSVICREKKFVTIYKNGVAGPHPMKFDAYKDSVSVAIFKRPVVYGEREIRIIFLINFMKGHIFLHKRVSNVMIQLIENDEFLNNTVKCSNFDQFIYELKKYVKKERG